MTKWHVCECPKCEGWGWIATDGDRSKPQDCDNCRGDGIVKFPAAGEEARKEGK